MYPDHERKPEQLVFHLSEQGELNTHPQIARNAAQSIGINPKYLDYLCGACGKTTSGRVLCDVTRTDGHLVSWCLCSCEKMEPTVICQKSGLTTMQLPQARKFHSEPEWPQEIASLYDEAAKSFAGGAFTSVSMVCRKILMSVACHEQEKAGNSVEEGKSFTYYVDYLANNVLTFDGAKQPMDRIKQIGNEANHHIEMVSESDAERSLSIVRHMLNAIYSFPKA